ncbi:Bifunctional nuclease 1 [Picochlorum sp. SENEW3]|nr:Bifunctional nuclease 1 [Picochlorum sp. SENEW3]WPT14912.1 Bifunctional nuclease 1 [Picochlorum sp. SENEW3]
MMTRCCSVAFSTTKMTLVGKCPTVCLKDTRRVMAAVMVKKGQDAWRWWDGHAKRLYVGRRHSTQDCFKVKAGGDGSQFDISMYHEAEISEVRTAEGQGNVIFLKLKDGQNSILPVYIGEYECGALIKEIHKRNLPRPGTHDLLKNLIDIMGYRVTKVRITALVGNIYHARIHLLSGEGDTEEEEFDVDSRPSDAINMAARFHVPIYVNKDVAAKMAHPGQSHEKQGGSPFTLHGSETDRALLKQHNEIIRSCKEEILLYNDPTMMHKLQLQLAIAEERFEDATKLRDVIDKLLASDRSLSLVIAIETALEDQRFEEAARLRDELRAFRRKNEPSSDLVDS